jgi:hypothetical protein
MWNFDLEKASWVGRALELTLIKYVGLIFITITLDREVILSFQYIERTGVKVDQIFSLLMNSINYLRLWLEQIHMRNLSIIIGLILFNMNTYFYL